MTAPIVDLLADLMADTIAVRTALTFDGVGRVSSYSATAARKCKITGRTRQVTDPSGKVRTSNVQATFDGAYNLQVEDEYTLPERFVPRIMPCIVVKRVSDENGPHHEVAFF